MGMKRAKWKALLVASLAAGATLASSAIPGSVIAIYPGIMGCEKSCSVAAGGWPFPYLIDYPGISPMGSVSLTDSILGIDIIWAGALGATFLCWIGIIAAVIWTLGRTRLSNAAYFRR
jgi:hypothetical protein